MLRRLKSWAGRVKRDVLALWLAARDPRTPRLAKVIAIGVVAYALSPIDLIPDVIPVLGYLDDLVILPLGILAAVALIPQPLMAEFRDRAADMRPGQRSKAAAIVIVLIWLGLVLAVLRAMRARGLILNLPPVDIPATCGEEPPRC